MLIGANHEIRQSPNNLKNVVFGQSPIKPSKLQQYKQMTDQSRVFNYDQIAELGLPDYLSMSKKEQPMLSSARATYAPIPHTTQALPWLILKIDIDFQF